VLSAATSFSPWRRFCRRRHITGEHSLDIGIPTALVLFSREHELWNSNLVKVKRESAT
jgi:hypothetical protein